MRGLFVGLCTKDVIFYTDDLPAQNHKAKTESFATYIGGPAANAAITLFFTASPFRRLIVHQKA